MTTTLQMPENYVEMTDEEMMYLDGGRMNFFGKNWWNSRGTVATGINVALLATGLGLATYSWGYVGKHAVKTQRHKIISAINKVLGSKAGTFANTGIGVALEIAASSIGDAVAYGLDWADGSCNGYVFG
jgi:hypothetical protein